MALHVTGCVCGDELGGGGGLACGGGDGEGAPVQPLDEPADHLQSQPLLQPRHWSSLHELLLEHPAPTAWHPATDPHPKLTLLVGLPLLK